MICCWIRNSPRKTLLLSLGLLCAFASISLTLWISAHLPETNKFLLKVKHDQTQTSGDNWSELLFQQYKDARIVLFDGENQPINNTGETQYREFSPLDIQATRSDIQSTSTIASLFAEGLLCNSILYTTHDGKRPIDSELDRYRVAWSRHQDLNCFFIINVHTAGTNQTRIENLIAIKEWRKRTANDPIVLVERYKAGLILMALVRLKYIRTVIPGEEPWILYVDSDSMMTNYRQSIENISSRVRRASSVRTLEKAFCGSGPGNLYSCPYKDIATDDQLSDIHLVISLSDYCFRGYFTHSGAILFRANYLNGFIFDVLASSPQYVIDTKVYRMGDQAIWDWLMEREFGTDWKQIRLMCKDVDRLTIFRQPCEGDQFIFTRKLIGTQNRDTHPLLIKMERKWLPLDEEMNPLAAKSSVAFVCVRWFNSPGCLGRHGPITDFFEFHCGDLLWHLYGCDKRMWKQESALNSLLMSPSCQSLLPLPLPTRAN